MRAKKILIELRQIFFPKGVWVAYNIDYTGFAVFEDELPARRYASEEGGMEVGFVRYGYDVRQEMLRR